MKVTYIKATCLAMMAITIALHTACNKWLDLQPESEISATVLFSTENGFQEALIGIYTRCTEGDIYGKELTIGTPEVLAQNYSLASDDPFDYRQTSLYNYKQGAFMDRRDNIWKGLYNAIVNSNLILANIDEKQSIFTSNNYGLIKGEALALRAYLHFDALRLFAPSYLKNPSASGVPYVTTYSTDPTPMSTVAEVIDQAIADLEEAKQLLVNDPIRSASYIVGYPTVTDTTQNTEEKSTSLFLQNRRHRLNYYAVCGTLARVYLYKGDKANALVNAKEVISSNKFPWTTQSDFLAFDEDKKDRILYKELIFGWYIPTMSDDYNENWFRTSTSGMYLRDDAGKALYEIAGIGADDLRYKQWFNQVGDQTTKSLEILKYRRNEESDDDDANLHYLMAPAIRLSEMYYIAAECSYASSPSQATDYVDQVRFVRGIGDKLQVASEGELTTELLKEFRKETYAEGQMFYMYKRLNRSIALASGGSVPASDDVFVFPLPDDEIIYGGR